MGLADVFADHVFVGCVDANQALIQHRLTLYLVQIPALAIDYFQQLILEGFECFQPLRLDPPPPLRKLLTLALLHCTEAKRPFATLDVGDQEAVLEECLEEGLRPHLPLLRAYFGIDISDDMTLLSLPRILEQLLPDWIQLPTFVYTLATQINYIHETECFRQIVHALALLFAPPPLDDAILDPEQRKARKWTIEFVLLDSLKGGGFFPSRKMVEGPVRKLCSIDNLYKIFERC